MSTTIAFQSIDQNCHPLWDTVPKLAALSHHGLTGIHYLEDIDVACTRRGAEVDDQRLEVCRERTYRGGVSDWGASLFYTELFGRNPLDVRRLEPYVGMTCKALAGLLQLSVDQLYENYSLSDNWQMIGSSYLGDRQRHRVIGDLTVGETTEALRDILARAEHNLHWSFPDPEARRRLDDWFGRERHCLQNILAELPDDAPLVDLYRSWMQAHLGTTPQMKLTSQRFSLARPEVSEHALVGHFLNDYPHLATLYNTAVETTDLGLNRLATDSGELPFFLIWRQHGRMFRTATALVDRRLVADTCDWPLLESRSGWRLPVESMLKAGVVAIAGKALLLVLQARSGPLGAPLALPYRGSAYMPAALAFEQALRQAKLLPEPLHPILRVRLRFLDSLRHSTTQVRLPRHLRPAFESTELPAAEFAARLPTVLQRARHDLELLAQPDQRDRLLACLAPDFALEIEGLEASRRQFAANPASRPQAAALWDRIKILRRQQTEILVDHVVATLHTADLDYFDSRGALLPWSVAVGGQDHYQMLIDQAEIYAEQQPAG